MDSKSERKRMYVEWLTKVWLETGGLITPTMAGKLLNKTKQRIKQMINEGKIKGYRYSEKEHIKVSFTEIMKHKGNKNS